MDILDFAIQMELDGRAYYRNSADQTANPDWAVALLRYFNPIGAHESGMIGAVVYEP